MQPKNFKKPLEFKPKSAAKVKLVYFSQARVNLNQECTHHPVLLSLLMDLPDPDWSEQLAEIAAYCNVLMDGVYSEEDLEILYPQLTKRMSDTRLSYKSGIIIRSH
tara:strand:- start:9744 stop:10061 length:318 start_codon:yes stop_codon:yes gene_type:complete